MYITDLDHSSTGFCTAFIVLAVPTVPAMPRVRPLNYPAFRPRRKAFRTLWTRRDLDVPPGTMLCHPGVQSVVVILLIRKNGHETRKVAGRDVAEQERGGHPISETGTGNEDGEQQPQRIDQEMPLASVDLLAPVIPPLRAPTSVVLTDGLSMQMALGVGSRPACTRVCSRNARTIVVHVPSSRHWAK